MQARDLRARDLFGQVKPLVEGFEAERKARQAAEAANKAKSELLATISHELRTPMEAVVAMGELLLRHRSTRRSNAMPRRCFSLRAAC